MNKELTLDERIQKLFESGWINEFNYLENQLQEARYLLVCLNEKYNQLTNNWNELEEWVKEYIIKNDKWYSDLSSNDKQYYGDTYYNTNYMLEKFLDKMKEIKGDEE